MGAGPADAVLGEVIAGRYRVVEILGDGGMGVVYRGEDTRLEGRAVAIKVLVPSGEIDRNAASRFDREARIMSRLNHPNLVAIHDTGQLDDERPFIVMELLEGETLAERAARAPIAVDELEALATQIGRGLDAAHRSGVVHRDLKPHNIFLCGVRDEEPVVKLLDFGISKLVGSMTMRTETTQIVGTPQYMSPEQARGEHELISPRSDVFAFATIIYELVAGRRPFDGQMLHEVVFKIIDHQPPLLTEVSDVPERIAAAVAVGMSKEPRDRFASAGAMVRALTGEDPVELPQPDAGDDPDAVPTVRDRPPRRATESETADADADVKRRWRWAWLPVAALALAAVGFGLRDRAVNGYPHRIGERLDALDAAIAAGDRGRAAMGLGRDREALMLLIQAYRAGDDRAATRVALRRAMAGADALIASLDFDADLEGVDLHPDGEELLIRDRGQVRLIDLEGRVLATIADEAFSAGYSTDGRRIQYSDARGVHVLDRASRAELQLFADTAAAGPLIGDSLIGLRTQRNSMELRYVKLALGNDKPVWEVVCELATSGMFAREVSGRRAVFCPVNPKLIDLETGELIARLRTEAARLVVLPGGERVVAFDDAGAARLFNDRGEATRLSREAVPISTGSLSDDGTLMALVTRGSGVEIRAAGDPQLPLLRRLVGGGLVTATRFIPDDTALAIGDDGGGLSVFDATTGRKILAATGHASAITGMLTSSHGKRLATLSGDQIKVWDLTRARDRVLFRDATGPFALDATATRIAARVEGGVRVIGGREPRLLQVDDSQWLLSRSGRWLVNAGRVVDLDSGVTTTLAEGSVRSALSDGAELVTFDVGGQTLVFRRREDRFTQIGELGPDFVAAVSADGGVIAASSRELLELRDPDFELLARRELPTPELGSFVAANGEVLVTLVPDATRLWWWRSDRLLTLPDTQFPYIRRGRDEILVRRRKGVVRVDLTAGEPLVIDLPCDYETGSASERTLLFRCRDNDFRLWDLEAGTEIMRVDQRLLGFTPLVARMSESGDRAIVRKDELIVELDLGAEDRPIAEIETIAARLLGSVPPPL